MPLCVAGPPHADTRRRCISWTRCLASLRAASQKEVVRFTQKKSSEDEQRRIGRTREHASCMAQVAEEGCGRLNRVGGEAVGRIRSTVRRLGGRPDRTTTEELPGTIVARSPSHHGRALQEWRGDAKPFLGTLDREGRAARRVEWRRGGNVRWVLLDVVWIRDMLCVSMGIYCLLLF